LRIGCPSSSFLRTLILSSKDKNFFLEDIAVRKQHRTGSDRPTGNASYFAGVLSPEPVSGMVA
jgi:hypothetical protein